MMNRVNLMGRLTADPELRHTQNSVAVATFRIAVDRDYKDKSSGERGVDFLPIVCWRSTAELASKYLSKGRMVGIDGRIQVRDYTDKDGNKRSITEIVADSITFADSKKTADGPKDQQGGGGDPYDQFGEVDDDDIPF